MIVFIQSQRGSLLLYQGKHILRQDVHPAPLRNLSCKVRYYYEVLLTQHWGHVEYSRSIYSI